MGAGVLPRWAGLEGPLLDRLWRRGRPARTAVVGHVLSAKVVEQAGLGGRPLYAAEVRFLYNVNARTREGRWTGPASPDRRRAESWAARHGSGTRARVLYDPSDPTRAVPQFGTSGAGLRSPSPIQSV